MQPRPAAGSLAPDFTASVIGGQFAEPASLQLHSLAGRQVVLYFYPKDGTPGCTSQACALRDGWEEVRSRAEVFGISPDSIESHRKFLAKHHLPFPLLSDPGHAIAEAWGVWVEKKLYGKTWFGVERTTFILNPDLRIRAVLPKVKPDQHLSAVLAQLA